MKLSELIRKRKVATATVATLATVAPALPPSVATVASVAVAIATGEPIKPLSIQDRQREDRRQKVIAMLEAAPGTQRAIYVDDASDPHNVILAIAVRHPTPATCEMLIPKAKYDPWRLLELIERHGQTTH